MSYLNSKGVAHRDLKLENVLVDKNLRLKVMGFGSATFKNINKLESQKGTQGYIAPEILKSLPYDGFKTDIFSLGVILFILVKGHYPFSQATESDPLYKLIHQSNFDLYFEKIDPSSTFSPDLRALFCLLLNSDPKKRPTI